MIDKNMRNMIIAVLCAGLLICGCSRTAQPQATFPEPAVPATSSEVPEASEETTSDTTAESETEPVYSGPSDHSRAIVQEMILDHGAYGEAADPRISQLMAELRSEDPDYAARWERILDMWRYPDPDYTLNYGVLPDGLCDTDELCIVVLGFALNPDGTMRDELIGRLTAAKLSAEKYPNALIVCTGGGTAAMDASATEGGRMAGWLEDNGIDPDRIIVEDRSLSTSQNAMFTYDILMEQYPQVDQIALVSSDYHIAMAELVFTGESILRSPGSDGQVYTIVSNAAYQGTPRTLSQMFTAGGLLELAGDSESAFQIYYDTYDTGRLPRID